MSLSRFAAPSNASFRLCVIPVRAAHAAAAPASGVSVKAEELDNPGFFQKIALRFKGIPLKGELHRPKSMFDDCDKEWFAPHPLPAMPKDYKEYPERDLVNFPYPERQMYAPKTRLLMIPDSWMTPFHKVTGTSGPYLFFGGLFAFLVNKELWVFEEQGHMLCGWILFYLLISRTVGYKFDKYLYGEFQNRMNHFKSLIEDDLKEAVEFRKNSAAETEALLAVKEKFPVIFKENMALQLEAAYRANVEQVATEMKRRIDYLQETESTKHRFEREHMLNWINENVVKEVDQKAFREQYMQTCIKQLGEVSAQK